MITNSGTHTTAPGARWVRNALEFGSFCRYLFRRFIDDGCQQTAAALTFMTLIALVPLMTVGFAMFSAVPAFENFGADVQNFVFRHFVPSSGAEVQDYLNEFSARARSLTALGVGILGLAAYTMLRNIEKSFNRIWRTREHRKGLSTFLMYWAILSLGPILLGAGLGMTTYLKVFVSDYDVLGMLPFVFKFLPWLLTSLTFTLLFYAVPNCRVPIRDALIGGFISGTFFEVAKNLFATYIANSSYQEIYGAFVMIPIFLIWLQLSWLLVLLGAEICHALSSYNSRYARHYPDLIVATQILRHFWSKQKTGGTVSESFFLTTDWMFNQSVKLEQWERIRNQLIKNNIIAVTERDELILARDLHQVSLWDLQLVLNERLHSLYTDPVLESADSARQEREQKWYQQLMSIVREQQNSHQRRYNVSLAQLFLQDPNDAGTTLQDSAND